MSYVNCDSRGRIVIGDLCCDKCIVINLVCIGNYIEIFCIDCGISLDSMGNDVSLIDIWSIEVCILYGYKVMIDIEVC